MDPSSHKRRSRPSSSFGRLLESPKKRKEKEIEAEFKDLVYKISKALMTLLQGSKKHHEQLWPSGFITDGDLIEVWETPRQSGSYLDQVSQLLSLNEANKAFLQNHFLKSVSTLILAGLFELNFDWKNILRQNNALGDRDLPITPHKGCNLSFLRLDQLDLFAQWQYTFLPYSIKQMKALKHRDDLEPAISDQYRLPFHGDGKPLTYTGTMTVTREKIPKGLLVFKDGSTSQQDEYKDVKAFPASLRLQFVKECRTQSLLKESAHLHPNVFVYFSYVSILNGPAFLIMDPASCNLRELLYGEERPLVEQLRDEPSSLLWDALGVASALEWLHSSILMKDETRLECIHMNLNPENILVFQHEELGNRWKISDFGVSVARLTGDRFSESPESRITTNMQPYAEYQAPEAVFTPDQVGYSNDVWSFGCILMEVLAFLKGGSPKVMELQAIRRGSSYLNTFWYEFEGEDHSLRVAIRDWLINIVGEDALLWERHWRDLTLDILQGKEDCRPSASKVYARLHHIIERGSEVKLVSRGTQHSGKVEMVSRGIQCAIEIDFPEVISREAPSSTKDGSTLDLMKIKRWLDSCEECLANQVQDEITAIIDLYESLELHSRVIDVIRLRVVPAPKRCRYVALSYVWGGRQRWTLRESNEKFFRNDGALEPNKCSKAIWDAILLCQEIGERYLWVDALCIVQDTEDKHAQIQSMEAIYRGAVLTIVAAAGEHADAGLPGVSNTARKFLNLGDQHGHADPNSFDTAVNSSIWNTRAWTYQERILSQRLLVFTTGQIFFHCSHGRASEIDGEDPHDALVLRRNTQPAQLDSHKLELERNINFNTYAQITEEYSRRILTHEDDIENAFGGIKKIVSLLFSSETTFCVPFAALDISLLWYPATDLLQRRCVETRSHKLRSRFPSWSWAGWVGSVYYKDLVNISERTVSCVRWRQPEDFRVLYASGFGKNTSFWPRHEDWLRQVTPEGQSYYTRRNGNPSHWFCHPVARFIHDPVPLDRNTGHLLFSTDKVKSAPWRMEDPKSSGSNCLRIFHNTSGFQLGKVNMHMCYNPIEEYEFLKISSTTLTEGEKDPAWRGATAQFSGTPGGPARNLLNMDTSSASEWFDPAAYDPTVCFSLYNVLVTVIRDDVTYRVGIGKIHIHAFDEIAVRDQLVRLG